MISRWKCYKRGKGTQKKDLALSMDKKTLVKYIRNSLY